MAQPPKLPQSLKVERRGAVAILTLGAAREAQRAQRRDRARPRDVLRRAARRREGGRARRATASISPPASTLSELKVLYAEEGIAHSRGWHRAFDRIEFGHVPVVTVMHGAVVGGGLELAAGDAYPRRRALGLLRAARGHARHLRGRRRLGARAAPDRRRAHDGHDAHRPHLWRRGGAGDRPLALSGRRRRGAGQGHRAREAHRRPIRRPPISPSCTRCRASPSRTAPAAT